MKRSMLLVGPAGAAVALALGALVAGCEAEETAPEARRSPVVIEHISAELDLDAAQRGRLDSAHEILAEHRETHLAEREERFGRLRDAVASGDLSAEEVHAGIDAKVDEVRRLAHQVADELIPFVRSLDDDQRAAAVELMDRFHDRMQALHERMEAGGEGMTGPLARLRAHHDGLESWVRGD